MLFFGPSVAFCLGVGDSLNAYVFILFYQGLEGETDETVFLLSDNTAKLTSAMTYVQYIQLNANEWCSSLNIQFVVWNLLFLFGTWLDRCPSYWKGKRTSTSIPILLRLFWNVLRYLAESFVYSIDWLIDRRFEWSTSGLIDWLIDWIGSFLFLGTAFGHFFRDGGKTHGTEKHSKFGVPGTPAMIFCPITIFWVSGE